MVEGPFAKCFLKRLRDREIGLQKCVCRHDYKSYANILISDTRAFENVALYNSRYPIQFEKDRIYLKHYRFARHVINDRLCYHLELEKLVSFSDANEKIVDAVLVDSHLPTRSLFNCGEIFVGLTNKNRLLVLEANRGRLLRSFVLPSTRQGYKFTELGAAKESETLYVKGRVKKITIESIPAEGSERNGVRDEPTSSNIVFMLFTISPFQLSAFIELEAKNKKVKVENFGATVKSQLGSENVATNVFIEKDGCVRIEEVPPVLYVVKAASDTLELGGFPWHCLYRPPKQLSYRLQDVANASLVTGYGAHLQQNILGQGMEVNVFFHPDESGSVVSVFGNTVSCYAFGHVDNEEPLNLKTKWYVNADDKLQSSDEPTVQWKYSSRGRRIAVKHSQDSSSYIDCLNYCSATDLVCLTVHREAESVDNVISENSDFRRSQTSDGRLQVLLVDNNNGRIVRQLLLDEPYKNECEEHHVDLHLDLLIHTIKRRSGQFTCRVYRLMEKFDDKSSSAICASVSRSASNSRANVRRRRQNVR